MIRCARVPAGILLAVCLAGASAPARGADPTSVAEAAAPSPAPADSTSESPVTVTARISPDPSNIGDVLTLEVSAAYPRTHSVNLPIGLKLDPFYLIDIDEGEPEPTGDGLRKTYRLQLQHFAPGAATVPGFKLTYVDDQGAIHTVAVPPTELTVEALLANEADPVRKLEDPPVSIEYPNTTAEIIIYAALATLLLAALAAWLIRRMLSRRRPVQTVPAAPAHELALAALDELERGDLLAQGAVQTYYVELTEIAKAYLERRFGIPALDRTTDEIRQSLVRNAERIAPLSSTEVIEFLHRCDLVKFARQHPPTEEAEQALGYVRHSVERTIPRQAAANPATKPSGPDSNAPATATDNPQSAADESQRSSP